MKRRERRVLCATGWIVTASCAAGRDVSHPRAEYVVREQPISAEVAFAVPAKFPEAFSDFEERIARLAGAKPNVEVGRSNGSRFGFVSDLEVDAEGNFYVLDDRLNQLTVHTQDGSVKYVLGRSGRGPGEYVEPRAVALSPRGHVFIGDLTRRLLAYRRGPTGEIAGTSSSTEIAIEDLCVMGTEIMTHARSMTRKELVFVLDTNGKMLRSFGELYRSPNVRINTEIARGRIACAPREGIVLYVPNGSIPEVRGYEPSGRLRWVTSVSGFAPVDMIQPSGRPQAIRVSAPAGGFHRVHSVIYDGEGNFILQIAFNSAQTARRRHGFDTLYTFVLSAADGRGLMLSDDLPTIGALRRDFSITIDNGVQPVVRRVDLRSGR